MQSSTLDRSPLDRGPAKDEDGGTAPGMPAPVLIEEWLNTSAQTAFLNAPGRWTVKGPLTSSPISATYQASCPGGPKLFLKHPAPGGESALAQYEALIKAQERLAGTTRSRVPKAYRFLLDRGFLVTEWIEGPAVMHLLCRPAARPHSVVHALEQAGTWLRDFHNDTAETRIFIDTGKLIDDARAAINRFADWRAAPAAFKDHLALLERIRPVLDDTPVPVSLLHGDFKPSNLIISADSAVAVDISAKFSGAVTDDLAHFLLHLDFELLGPRGCRFLPWGRAFETAFLRGYDPGAVRVPHVVVAWCRLQRVLRHYEVPMEHEDNRMRGTLQKARYALCAAHSARQLRRAYEASGPLS